MLKAESEKFQEMFSMVQVDEKWFIKINKKAIYSLRRIFFPPNASKQKIYCQSHVSDSSRDTAFGFS